MEFSLFIVSLPETFTSSLIVKVKCPLGLNKLLTNHCKIGKQGGGKKQSWTGIGLQFHWNLVFNVNTLHSAVRAAVNVS